MEIPVYDQARREGLLRIRPEGLYTLFETRLPPRPGLWRLWLAGGGQQVCLGLLEPRPDGLYLCRRLSRRERCRLPGKPERALLLPNGSAPERPRPQAAAVSSPCGWRPRPDGSLVDPARRLLALPCALGAAPRGARKLTLDGREYLVFRY